MKSLSTITIETERLILRRFKLDDAEEMFYSWANDDLVIKYLTWPTHDSVEVTKMVVNMWVNNYYNPDYYQWGIVLKSTNELIGSIGVVRLELDSAEVGYCMARRYWNKGIMSEALRSLIEFLFNEVEVKKVTACHDKDNPASGKVMEKCGMKYTHKVIARNNTNENCICLYYEIENK